jgi:hypothetical protein
MFQEMFQIDSLISPECRYLFLAIFHAAPRLGNVTSSSAGYAMRTLQEFTWMG